MQRILYRTGQTDLSGDELLLLDVLFNCAASFDSLRRECFQERWNAKNHNFNDQELKFTLDRMRGRDILAAELDAVVPYFRMTERGGELWSLERCPIWETYASERYGETTPGKPVVTIVTTSATICDDFLRLGGPSGMWKLGGVRVRNFVIRNHQIIPWRKFPQFFVAIAVDVKEEGSADVVALDERRTWWRCVRELQKLLPAV